MGLIGNGYPGFMYLLQVLEFGNKDSRPWNSREIVSHVGHWKSWKFLGVCFIVVEWLHVKQAKLEQISNQSLKLELPVWLSHSNSIFLVHGIWKKSCPGMSSRKTLNFYSKKNWTLEIIWFFSFAPSQQEIEQFQKICSLLGISLGGNLLS